MKETRLTYALVKEICHLVKLRLNWTQIADAIGMHPETIRVWRRKGDQAKSGVHCALVEGINKAKSELIVEAAEAVEGNILQGGEKITEREVLDKDGNIRTLRTIERTSPDAALALRVLERLHPAVYAPVHQVQVDWRDLTEKQGADPDKVATGFKRQLALLATEETATLEESTV